MKEEVINKKENVLRELFGSMKFGDSEKVLKEVRKDLENKWMKENDRN